MFGVALQKCLQYVRHKTLVFPLHSEKLTKHDAINNLFDLSTGNCTYM